ncbi:hypothetical protein D9M68_732520 [compost metagenome]
MGWRVFAASMAIRVSLGWPCENSLSMGMNSPSMCTSVPSGPKPRPPMSITWLVAQNSATGLPARKQGVTTTKSFRCPVPFQGSLVMKTSPSRMLLSGYLPRKCLTDSAMVLTCPGAPVMACASMRPRVSNTPAERSLHSRTMALKAVRSSTWACSSTVAMRRCNIS